MQTTVQMCFATNNILLIRNKRVANRDLDMKTNLEIDW